MRLLLVHTGGTLMMRGDESAPLKAGEYARGLLAELPVLTKIADIDTRILLRIDSSEMQPEKWVAIARSIHESLDDYDGVVVVHGTDTMAYTASALAFLLPDLGKPVILTGSQRPLQRVRSDARQNLINAFQLACMPVPEVALAFADKLLRGCRATKLDAWGLAAFGSPNCRPLAELGIGIELADHVLKPRVAAPFDDRIEPRVLAVGLFPGLEPRLLTAALDTGVRGLILKAFGAGNVPTLERSFIPVIEKARRLDVPVVIVSQCLRAHVELTRYTGGAAALEAGAIGAGDMTDEAALTKLMIALGRAQDGDSRVEWARRAFAQSWAGEISHV